jgi:hypothetical protein
MRILNARYNSFMTASSLGKWTLVFGSLHGFGPVDGPDIGGHLLAVLPRRKTQAVPYDVNEPGLDTRKVRVSGNKMLHLNKNSNVGILLISNGTGNGRCRANGFTLLANIFQN